MTLLGIETSGKTASVAILKDGTVMACETVYTTLTHSQTIVPMIQRAVQSASMTFDDIEKIAVSAGPGSYTGIRIGIAAAKGMCLKNDLPVCGVSTLKALGYNLIPFEGNILSVMKARDKIAYFAAFKSDGQRLHTLKEDCVCNIDSIPEVANALTGRTLLVGDWAEYIKSELFLNDERVNTAPPHKLLQDAKGVCAAAIADGNFLPADKLKASYLQITKAEKDRLS